MATCSIYRGCISNIEGAYPSELPFCIVLPLYFSDFNVSLNITCTPVLRCQNTSNISRDKSLQDVKIIKF